MDNITAQFDVNIHVEFVAKNRYGEELIDVGSVTISKTVKATTLADLANLLTYLEQTPSK